MFEQFQIWTFCSFEIFYVWIISKFEHFLNLNIFEYFKIWTIFIFEHFLNLIPFRFEHFHVGMFFNLNFQSEHLFLKPKKLILIFS
jgi:hypothetical protein